MNSSHPGAMASFALEAANNGFCCFSFTHADSLVQSFNSKERFFGTNPICFSAPRKDEEPFCLDMAPTFIPWNKILDLKEKDLKLEKNVAVDKEGNPTLDPSKAYSLLPIGGYKGYGIAFMVEILCSTLSGMKFGKHIPTMYGAPINEKRNLGQFYILFKTDVNVHADHFADTLHTMCQEVRSQMPISNQSRVLAPNDPQIAISEERKRLGIPISREIYELIMSN
tara:strand:- start:33 stop:707 length:675 start_codon:yes stop_codon:yes gene_type:complete